MVEGEEGEGEEEGREEEEEEEEEERKQEYVYEWEYMIIYDWFQWWGLRICIFRHPLRWFWYVAYFGNHYL